MKFSIIVPVYNVEKYIRKCLESLISQTFQDYEILVINDGSTDNSQNIIDEIAKKSNKVKSFIKENGGLSDARNFGIKKASGDYLLFIDSDDYVDENLLYVLSSVIKENNKMDLIRFPKKCVTEEGIEISQDKINTFDNINGQEAFIIIRQNRITLETACTYAYKREYFLRNKFEFAKGKVHEDLGLIPFVIFNADSVSAIDKPYYYYVQREGSIINTKSAEKDFRKAKDVLYHYDFLMQEVDRYSKTNSLNSKAQHLYYMYIIDAVYNKLRLLEGENYKFICEEIKKRKIIKKIKVKSFKDLIKKVIYFFLERR